MNRLLTMPHRARAVSVVLPPTHRVLFAFATLLGGVISLGAPLSARAQVASSAAQVSSLAQVSSPAQVSPPAQSGRQDPLAARQQIARDRMTQLEDRMYRLAEKLRETEPEQAERMEQALRRARELLIRRHMEQAVELLEAGDLSTAGDRQQAVIKNLEHLLKVLMEDTDQAEKLQEELERLREFRDQVEDLRREQRDLQARTEATSRPADSDSEAPGDAAEAARQQRELSEKAAELARRMAGRDGAGQDGADQSADADATSRPGEQGGQADPAAGKEGADAASGQPGESPPQDGSPQQGDASPQSGQPGQSGQSSSPAAPGTQNVQQAQQHMDQAADQLGQQQAGEAQQQQQKAIEQLEQALRELQETLEQLRREQQEEILRGLESRFRAMLTRQTAVNEGTVALESKGPAAWVHADELQLAGFAQEQTALGREAADALYILREEGTAIVFPQIVEQLRDDMQTSADLLRERDTGQVTQAVQAEIAATLEELIEAVEQMRRQLSEGNAPSDPSPGQQGAPLLPDSAELKLLKACQVRVNRHTQSLAATLEGEPGSEPVASNRLQRLAQRQQEVADMARKMNERMTGR